MSNFTLVGTEMHKVSFCGVPVIAEELVGKIKYVLDKGLVKDVTFCMKCDLLTTYTKRKKILCKADFI